MNVECLHPIFSLEVSSNLDETKNAPKGFVFLYGAFLLSKKDGYWNIRRCFVDMKVVKSEKRICPCCMEEHVVKTVLVMDHTTFKNSLVNYEASYFFCDLAKEFYMDEQQMRDNNIKLKDAYRKRMNLNAAALK